MNKLKKINDYYKVLVGVVATLLTTLLNSTFSSINQNENLSNLIIITLMSSFIIILNILFDNLLDYSQLLRRLILGDEFIEGYWYDLSIDKESNKLKHGVLILIEYSNYSYDVTGVTFDGSGERVATFKSTISHYNDRKLFLQYESHTRYQESGIEVGINELSFDNPPTSYTGFYMDYGNNLRYKIFGTKVTDKEIKEFNTFLQIENKRDYLLSKFKEKGKI